MTKLSHCLSVFQQQLLRRTYENYAVRQFKDWFGKGRVTSGEKHLGGGERSEVAGGFPNVSVEFTQSFFHLIVSVFKERHPREEPDEEIIA